MTAPVAAASDELPALRRTDTNYVGGHVRLPLSSWFLEPGVRPGTAHSTRDEAQARR